MSLATLSGPGGNLKLVIVEYTYALQSEIETAQVQHGLMHYPIKVLQADFEFTVQFRSVQEYATMQAFVQKADQQALSKAFTGSGALKAALNFYWPEMGIDYAGFMKTSPMGGKKFDFAPKVKYTMILVRDSIYSPSQNATQVPNFAAIAGPNLLDVDAATAEPPMIPPAPPTPPPTPPPLIPPREPAPAPSGSGPQNPIFGNGSGPQNPLLGGQD